jgi:L-aspartate oxidase
MTRGAGVLRGAAGLAATTEALAGFAATRGAAGTAAWEATNLVTVAGALCAAATRRTETRGCHWREDFEDADDAWLGHLVPAIAAGGELELRWQPAGRHSAEGDA